MIPIEKRNQVLGGEFDLKGIAKYILKISEKRNP